MGTAIVSIALWLEGAETASRVVFGIAVAVWLVLGVVLALRLADDRPRFMAEAASPGGLAAVAATAVIGARVVTLGDHALATALLALAAVFWVSLASVLVHHLPLPRTGSAFIVTVSTQSLAVLAALVSAPDHARWLLVVAIVACLLGLALYPIALARFDTHQLLVGSGDQWVAGGAVAICALAVAEISLAASRLGMFTSALPDCHAIAVVLWGLSVLWLAVLVGSEIVSPRLRYAHERWSTVFPVGMYAVCSHQVATAAGVAAIHDFASVWSWISIAVWLAAFVGLLWRFVALTALVH